MNDYDCSRLTTFVDPDADDRRPDRCLRFWNGAVIGAISGVLIYGAIWLLVRAI